MFPERVPAEREPNPPGATAGDTGPGEPAPDDGLALTTRDLSVEDLETTLRRRVRPRLRALSTALVTILLVAVVFGILRNIGARAPAASTPNPTVPGSPLLITANIARGTITLNGRRLGSPPVVVSSAALRPGANVLTLAAPPFAPQSCVIDGPLDVTGATYDSIAIATGNAYESISGSCYLDIGIAPAGVVGFTETGANLSPDLRLTALEAVSQALSGTAPDLTVPVGQYYAVGTDAHGRIISRRAGPRMLGVVVVQPRDIPAIGLTAPADLCAGFGCPAAVPDATRPALGAPGSTAQSWTTTQVWTIGEGTQATWSFVDQSGWPHLVGSATYPVETPLSLTLDYTTASTWSVVVPDGQNLASAVDLCGSGATLLEGYTPLTGYSVQQLAHGTTSLAGCVLDLVASDRSEHGRFVWRFGVLLAADARAHTLLPFLPLAPAAEIAGAGGLTIAGQNASWVVGAAS